MVAVGVALPGEVGGQAAMTEREEDDDAALILALGENDQEALAALLTGYRDRLRRMIEFRLDARLLARVSASDILQEAYVEALKRLPHFVADPSVPFYIWARSVTLQHLIDVHRRHLGARGRDAAREVRLGAGGSVGASSEKMADLMGEISSPSGAAMRGETRARVREALDRLEAIDREVLALRHFEELSNVEAAALLEITPAASSKRYLRAIERLREILERSGDFEGGP